MIDNRKTIATFLMGLTATAVLSLSGCQRALETESGSGVTDANLVTAGNENVNRKIGENGVNYTVLGQGAFSRMVANSEISLAGTARANSFMERLSAGTGLVSAPALAPAASATPAAGSLLLSLPVGMIGQQNIFGGVITGVSDATSETLGGLKLTDLTPLHVKTALSETKDGKAALALIGCTKDCTEASEQKGIIGFPIVGVNEAKKEIVIDLAAVGDSLDLMTIVDPDHSGTHLKTKTSKTVAFDYSLSTLVFDIESHMEPVDPPAAGAAAPAETVIKARWYLKLASAFNPAFDARPATDGVGFFMTERSKAPKIQRFSSTAFGQTPVKYYIKNVPTEYQDAFKSAFDAWNAQFTTIIGKNLIDYEFVPAGDPRNQLLVAGDVRYNIVEWDLLNKASYGGLGPSIANQFTGEILTANVLIQGPTIVDLYTKWFQANTRARDLMAAGRVEEAETLLWEAKQALGDRVAENTNQPKVALSLGSELDFRVTSQMPSYEDPLEQRDDFDVIPAGYTYAQYMAGYFKDMLGHELGHNLGLRHNFRGNLGAGETAAHGKVSRSIMEYLNRNFRYLDDIGVYDVMAITYGYTGKKPTQFDWYCTDEDVPTSDNLRASAECSRDDATPDPFGYLESRLTRSVDLLTARGSASAPVWTVPNMDKELGISVGGMALYAATADATASTWTNFAKAGRPSTPAAIKAYVVGRIKAQVCDPSLDALQKENADAKAKVAANLTALRAKVQALVTPLGIAAADVSCGQ